MKKRIMILGAGIMQIPAIKIAKTTGFTSIVLDGNPEAPGKDLADIFECIDLKDKKRILELAKRLKSEDEGLAGIMTAGTDFSSSVAFAAEKLNLPGIPYEVALDCSDKERMRRRFAACNVPSPAFLVLSDLPKENFHLPFPFPVVVKPVDNMGSRGCRRVENSSELSGAVLDALSFSGSKRVIVEEYMDGPEFSVDAIVHHGKVTICGLADRHIFFPPYFIEMGHTMPSDIALDTEAALLNTFIAGVQALGITEGAAKGDIKLGSKGPMIGEIAARLSGGYMSGWTYPYASGAHATQGALLVAVGEEPDGLEPEFHRVSAERAFISIPGTIDSIHGLDKAKNTKWIKDIFLRVKAGDTVSFPENNVGKCGNIISAAPKRDQAISGAEQAARAILIRLASPDKATDFFLASPLDTQFPPSAFSPHTSILRALEKLPESFPKAANQKLCLYPFPELLNSGLKDYMGRSVNESLNAVRALSGDPLPFLAEDESPPDGNEVGKNAVLGKKFWQFFLRGGYQGALYFLDSLKK
ncbi:MAG: ATP-grasp domain-containing protein [Spirochaetaceae bacterium]|jgi:biotin carboxylase|nr:ATP-grasp domain-containing protein [Spirochaetaceae bacterium]